MKRCNGQFISCQISGAQFKAKAKETEKTYPGAKENKSQSVTEMITLDLEVACEVVFPVDIIRSICLGETWQFVRVPFIQVIHPITT